MPFYENCRHCGQRLLLVRKDRDMCDRCEVRGAPVPPAPRVGREDRPLPPKVPCTSCGRDTTDDGGFALPLIDGVCLACRMGGSR